MGVGRGLGGGEAEGENWDNCKDINNKLFKFLKSSRLISLFPFNYSTNVFEFLVCVQRSTSWQSVSEQNRQFLLFWNL